MSEKFVFENARIKSLESKLLTRQSMQRLADSGSPAAAFRTLLDLGFGMGLNVEQGDFDALFEGEEIRNVETVKEFNVAGALDPLLLQYDYLNLKLQLKAIALGKREEERCPEGLKSFEEICEMCAEQDEEKLSGRMGMAILDVRRKGKATPREIDVAVDKRMFEDILACAKQKLVREYFRLKIDGANLLTYLRAKRLGLDAAFFEESFVKGGNLDISQLYDATTDKVCDAVKGSPLFEPFKRALEDGQVMAFEVAADNIALAYVRAQREDMFCVAPILAYALQKQTQLKAAKLVVAGIKNGVDPAVIKERLRDVNA